MARPRPITIALTALLGAILGVAFWLLARPRQPPAKPAAQESDELPSPPPPRPAPTPAAVRPPPARRTAPAPAVAAAQSPTPTPDPAPAAADAPAPIPFDVRRDVLVKTQNLRLSEADEEVFGALNLPEATRVRIRAINEEHRLRTERPISSNEPPSPRAGAALTSNEARQAALIQLLGSDGAKQFGQQERDTVRKIRGKYRYEWGRQLRE